jgi:GNAT superfamily N-acetyltransferase
MNIQLKKATLADLTIIEHLAKAIWQEHYVPMVGQAQVDYMLGRFYNTTALAKQADEGQQFWLIQKDGINEGYIALSEKSDGEYFLHKFYLSSALQGKGIGAKIFQDVLNLYKNLKIIKLQVNKNNYKSINFYFKMGFKIEKLFVLDIGEGFVMDDFLMVWSSGFNPNKNSEV